MEIHNSPFQKKDEKYGYDICGHQVDNMSSIVANVWSDVLSRIKILDRFQQDRDGEIIIITRRVIFVYHSVSSNKTSTLVPHVPVSVH